MLGVELSALPMLSCSMLSLDSTLSGTYVPILR